jgi:hypothetical protein
VWLCSAAGCHEPTLLLLVKYLLHLHIVFRSSCGVLLPEAELVDELLGGPCSRDAPGLPCEAAIAPSALNEALVQSLMQCSGSSRQAVVDALRHTGGDGICAFKHEISRIQARPYHMLPGRSHLAKVGTCSYCETFDSK